MKMVMVDDEVLTLKMLERILDWDKMEVQITGTALDGFEALKLVKKENPDIIIVDIKMPGMDGLELMDKLRTENVKSKIVILSAYGEFEYAQKAMSLGASGYLLKPVNELKLKELISKLVKEIKEEKEQIEKLRTAYFEAKDAVKHPFSSTDTALSENENNYLVQRVKTYIKENYSRDISLEDICRNIAVSRNYLCYLFKKETGENVWDYITHVRMNKAKELLEKTNSKNYEIASAIGYESASYFNKMFKRYTGVTPYEYKNRHLCT